MSGEICGFHQWRWRFPDEHSGDGNCGNAGNEHYNLSFDMSLGKVLVVDDDNNRIVLEYEDITGIKVTEV